MRLATLGWVLVVVAVVAIIAVTVFAILRSGETDADRACALVDGAVADAFGSSTRIEPDGGDCVIHRGRNVIVVHIFEDEATAADFEDSRRAVKETDSSVTDARVSGGDAFFADDRTTLWVWDPDSRLEFGLFTEAHGGPRLVALADRILAGNG